MIRASGDLRQEILLQQLLWQPPHFMLKLVLESTRRAARSKLLPTITSLQLQLFAFQELNFRAVTSAEQ
jgi:hypothetical protein